MVRFPTERRAGLVPEIQRWLCRNRLIEYVQQAIEKANTLIEALGWIRQFRDKTTVIKLGGSMLDDADALHHILLDIHFMETVGMRPVVVHGAGSRITKAMKAAGIEPRFIQGRRYTDEQTSKLSNGCWPRKPTSRWPRFMKKLVVGR